jgi:hypothetical protein
MSWDGVDEVIEDASLYAKQHTCWIGLYMHSKDGIITQRYPDNAEQLMLRERHQVLHSVGMDSVLLLITATAAPVELFPRNSRTEGFHNMSACINANIT